MSADLVDLVDLELFAHVAAAGTIAAGAAATGLAAASASERLRRVEARLGVALLARGPRGVVPTAAGAALLEHARRVHGQLEALRGELAAHRDGRAGRLRLLANTAACRELVPEALAGFLARHPRLAVELGERRSEEIVEALADGRAQLGIVSDAVDRAGLQERPLRDDPLALVVAETHPLARRPGGDAITLAQVLDEPFVGLAPGSALQEHVDAHARRLARVPAYRARVAELEAVCRLAGRGLGVGVVPESAARRCAAAAGLRVLPLADDWARRRLLLVAPSFAALAPAARRLARHLATPAPAGHGPAARPPGPPRAMSCLN
jgi:DNA-binding transcriptional LysR family regulator